jgi:DNA-binding MarR family transcriptional regulator
MTCIKPRFIFLLNCAQRSMQRWIESRPNAWDGVSSAQVGLLFLLASQEHASIGEIAQELHVAPAAVTNLSKRMQALDLVERISDDKDGRLTLLRLTSFGQKACGQAKVVLKDLNTRLTAGFSREELDTVARWLEQVGRFGDSE